MHLWRNMNHLWPWRPRKLPLLFDLQVEGAARDGLSLGAKQWISMLIFLQVGEALLYRPKTLDQHRKLLYDHLPQDLPLQIAEELASGFTQQILAIAAQDNYLETRSLPLFLYLPQDKMFGSLHHRHMARLLNLIGAVLDLFGLILCPFSLLFCPRRLSQLQAFIKQGILCILCGFS